MHNDFEDQIEKLQVQIDKLKIAAERNMNSDPETAIYKARKACELICKHICFREGLLIDKRDFNTTNLSKLIYLINQKNIVSRSLMADMKLIQYKGNTAGHSTEKINTADAEPVLKALSNLVNWYFRGTTLHEPEILEPESFSKPATPIKQDGFVEKTRGIFGSSLFKTAATTVMAATAAVLAHKGLSKSDKDENK